MSQTPPLPMPVRVLIKGSSIGVMSSELGGPRHHFTFGRAIESALGAAGHPAEVRNLAVVGGRTSTALLEWEREALAFSPDVVVLGYGFYESIHLALPWWLERHANSLTRRPGKVRAAYRKFLLGPAWMALARTQAKVDKRLSSTIRTGRPRRVAAHVERLIERTQQVGSPLVLVFEILPPAKRWRSWFPGMAERTEAMNAALEDMVKRVDKPNVRYFRTTDLVTRYFPSIEEATPDGGHFTPELHRAIGKALSVEILAWAADQPHLHGGAVDGV